jgi:hypothetical protein
MAIACQSNAIVDPVPLAFGAFMQAVRSEPSCMNGIPASCHCSLIQINSLLLGRLRNDSIASSMQGLHRVRQSAFTMVIPMEKPGFCACTKIRPL